MDDDIYTLAQYLIRNDDDMRETIKDNNHRVNLPHYNVQGTRAPT